MTFKNLKKGNPNLPTFKVLSYLKIQKRKKGKKKKIDIVTEWLEKVGGNPRCNW